MHKVFIDGSAGTTGLRIRKRLAERQDIELMTLPENLRKDENARRDMLNSADVVFLCLPDEAAIRAVKCVENPLVKIIDASTAHRTAEGWEYGFPELRGMRERIASSKRIANPGCHASGFIALVQPLIYAGILDGGARLSCFSVTGYSGGGRKMIEDYESRGDLYRSPRQYALAQRHKHLPEMQIVCGLKTVPLFCPVVADFYCGMEVTVPVFGSDIRGGADAVAELYKAVYGGGVIRYSNDDEDGFMKADAYAGRDCMAVSVYGNSERILLVARYDNLGKGASGAAIQNMNILLGEEETKGLVL